MMTFRQLFATTALLIHTATSLSAQTDMEGAADHEAFSRITGSVIAGYGSSSFDEGEFLKGNPDDFEVEFAGGELTQILYVAPAGQSATSALLNYQEVFQSLGEFEEAFICRRGSCPRNLGPDFVWRESNRFEVNIPSLGTYFFNYAHLHQNAAYLSGEITSDTGVYTVSVFAAEAARDRPSFSSGQPLVVLQIVRTERFQSDLEVVPADEIGSEIIASGFVTLSGLFFETNEDVLKETSEPALDEIARFLTSSPDIDVYIVGHTDNVGDVSYNQDLSQRRAQSIVRALITEYGIAESRIVPLGAGLSAPVASNRTEEGRAQNRRVELVER